MRQAGGLVEQTQVPADMAPTGYLSGVTPENSAQLAINQVSPGQILLVHELRRRTART